MEMEAMFITSIELWSVCLLLLQQKTHIQE